MQVGCTGVRHQFNDNGRLGGVFFFILYNFWKKLGQITTNNILNSRLNPMRFNPIVEDIPLRLLLCVCKPSHCIHDISVTWPFESSVALKIGGRLKDTHTPMAVLTHTNCSDRKIHHRHQSSMQRMQTGLNVVEKRCAVFQLFGGCVLQTHNRKTLDEGPL